MADPSFDRLLPVIVRERVETSNDGFDRTERALPPVLVRWFGERLIGYESIASGASEEARVAAAVALRSEDGAGPRLRIAADAVVSPKLRVALETVADPALDEALEAVTRR